jgi:hypothetical protein
VIDGGALSSSMVVQLLLVLMLELMQQLVEDGHGRPEKQHGCPV